MKWFRIALFCIPFCCHAATGTFSPAAAWPTGFLQGMAVISADSSTRPLRSKEEFMREYGKDDSSKALIRYYFFRSRKNRLLIWIPYVSAAPFVAGGFVMASRDPYKTGYSRSDDGLVLVAGIFLIVASLTAALIISLVNAGLYRGFRKRLLAALKTYRETGKIPRRISASTLFRVGLRGEPASVPWKQPKPAPRAATNR